MLQVINANFQILANNPLKLSRTRFCGLKSIEKDCFVKRTETNDTIQNKDLPGADFIKWAKERDFINTDLKRSFSSENYIGRGTESYIYKICGNEDYVLKIPKEYKDLAQTFDFSDCYIEDVTDENLNGNFGQQVAVIKDKAHKIPVIKILKKQEGIPNGNPPNGMCCIDIAYNDISRRIHCEKCLKILANMPDSAYENFVDDVAYLAKKGYSIDDYNSNNYLLDEENGRINIVDIDKTNIPYPARFGNLIYALIDLRFIDNYFSDLKYQPNSKKEAEITQNVATIIDKYINAVKTRGYKFSLKEDFELPPVLKHPVSNQYFQTSDYNEKIEKLCKLEMLQ